MEIRVSEDICKRARTDASAPPPTGGGTDSDLGDIALRLALDFAESGCFALQLAEVKEFGATDATAADAFDFVDHF